jgi:GTP:adenosylcobinamide-phosphate guanylyltransferase
MDKVDAVVLAGGGGIEEGAPVKALLPIGSRVMVDYVVEALKNSRGIERIVLVGPDELRSHYDQTAAFPEEHNYTAGQGLLAPCQHPGR